MHACERTFRDATVSLHDGVLILGNACLRRTLRLDGGLPSTLRLETADGVLLGDGDGAPDLSFPGLNLGAGGAATSFAPPEMTVSEVAASWRDGEHLRVDLRLHERVQDIEIVRSYLIYPDLPVLAVENAIRSAVSPNLYWSARGGLQQSTDEPALLEGCVDGLRLASGLRPLRSVEFRGRTDFGNDLVLDHPFTPGHTAMAGNLLFCGDGRHGVFWLQEAPPSSERRDFEGHDFRIAGDGGVRSCCWGIPPAELRPDRLLTGYRHVLGHYAGDHAGAVLKDYLRRRFPDGGRAVTVNPWGCGRFSGLVSEDFLHAEVVAAGRLGASHYQVDDGWQAGGGLAELTRNNRAMTAAFWDERFPGCLQRLGRSCRQAGVELSIWFAPSSTYEYRDWRTSAEVLMELHRRYGVCTFKLDGVRLRTKEAEDNFASLLTTLRERTAGRITFDFDVTNGQRQGYFMFLQHGRIFLENRYVCHTWGVGYHPEDTLRNLWRLSHHLRSQSLQIEIPSPDDINPDFYRLKGRTRPDAYPPDYWAAIALFASPLLWLAPSLLSPSVLATYRRMVELHLRHRDAILAGEVFPIGEAPSGSAVCGFCSHADASPNAWILVFRELGAPAGAAIPLPLSAPPAAGCSVVHASTSVTAAIGPDGRLDITFAAPACFALLRLSDIASANRPRRCG